MEVEASTETIYIPFLIESQTMSKTKKKKITLYLSYEDINNDLAGITVFLVWPIEGFEHHWRVVQKWSPWASFPLSHQLFQTQGTETAYPDITMEELMPLPYVCSSLK